MGIERTDLYYNQWAEMSNTIFVEGQYDSLFNSSDGMIHDCSTFMVEYLYTGKPLMFVKKEHSVYPLNEFGNQCLNLHYQGQDIKDIQKFLMDIVLQGNDPMYNSRQEFKNLELLPPNNRTVAENIYYAMSKSLVR